MRCPEDRICQHFTVNMQIARIGCVGVCSGQLYEIRHELEDLFFFFQTGTEGKHLIVI